MKITPRNLLPVTLLCLALSLNTSCNKDSDLLAEYVVQQEIATEVPKEVTLDLANALFTTDEDQSVSFNLLNNTTSNRKGRRRFKSNLKPTYGDITIEKDSIAVYTPSNDYNGKDDIEITLEVTNEDETTSEEVITIDVTVEPVEDVVEDIIEITEEAPVVIEPLKNDTFKKESEVIITEVSKPANGTVVINEDNTITYTPNTNTTIEETPVVETPVKETPVEETPVVETPVVETPIEETTVEEAPKEDTFTYTTSVTNPDNSVTEETGSIIITTPTQNPTTTGPIDMGELKAFPGAEGHGRYATGGRGGSVYQVTNLNDSGPGSFRDAISQGNRTIVFRVGGVIKINSRLDFGGDNITIAGETAPGDGIAIYGSMTDTNSHENIIIRYMNFLAGDSGRRDEDDSFRLRNSNSGAKSNFIFDHCGFFWGMDETFAIEANNAETGSVEKVTVQKSIIGESLNSKGMIIWRQGFDISFIDNLFSNNHERNIRSSTRYASWEQINNVIYNYYIGVNPTWSNEFDIIGNVFLKKGSSISDINIESTSGILNDTKAYLLDNTTDGKASSTNINGTPLKDSRQVSSGYTPIANSGTNVLDNVLNDVGANLNGNNTLAQKQISDVINRTGSWISSESQSVKLSLQGGTAYKDSDGDGMSDDWENANNLDPNNANDGKADANGDGYTNLEEFLHSLTI
jgi:hypothetical protein